MNWSTGRMSSRARLTDDEAGEVSFGIGTAHLDLAELLS